MKKIADFFTTAANPDIKLVEFDFESGQEPDNSDEDFATSFDASFIISGETLRKLLNVSNKQLEETVKKATIRQIANNLHKLERELIKLIKNKAQYLLLDELNGSVRINGLTLSSSTTYWDIEKRDPNKPSIQIQVQIECIGQNKVASIKAAALSDHDLKNIIRHIPTGSKVKTQLTDKALRIHIITTTSAPPLTTDDVPKLGKRLKEAVNSFIDDLVKRVTISNYKLDRYVMVEGDKNKILCHYDFSIEVKNKTEGKSLAQVDAALSQYK